MKRYTIGKMAKLNNVTEQTLRLYDKMGLFKPAYVDEHNGYRLYDIGQSARLDIIQYLKNLGMMHLNYLKLVNQQKKSKKFLIQKI